MENHNQMSHNNSSILKLAYFDRTTWIYPIVNELNEQIRKKYRSSDAKELGLSISTKLQLIYLIISRINDGISILKKEIKSKKDEVAICLQEDKALLISNEETAFLILADTELLFFEMKSIYDLLVKYSAQFNKILFNQTIRKLDFNNRCKNKGMGTDWNKYLDNIRNDFIHNYTGWLAFRKNGGNFDLLIELPDMQDKGCKKHNEEYLAQNEINRVVKDFHKFLGITRDILVEDIRKYKNNPTERL